MVVTWIPGEPFVELAAEDPQQGIIFYTLDDKEPVDKPSITRHNGDCLICHQSLASLGVPGTMVRSVLVSSSGTPLSYLGDTFPDHRTPFAERWGGWYVTGKRVPAGHRGNAAGHHREAKSTVMTGSANLESLQGLLDSDAYPTPYSDVVALLVFEHQMHMMNLLTRAGWEARVASYHAHSQPALCCEIWPANWRIIFCSSMSGRCPRGSRETPASPKNFPRRGRATARAGRCGEFDLEHRLMRYPCSYMIYSAAFDGLPAEVKSGDLQTDVADPFRAGTWREICKALAGRSSGCGRNFAGHQAGVARVFQTLSPGSGCGSPASSNLIHSVADPQREAELALAAFHVIGAAQRARDGHEASRGHVGARVVEMRRVREVVGLRAELDVQALFHLKIAEQRGIHVDQSGSEQRCCAR